MADCDTVECLSIPGKDCQNAGCKAKWGLGNQLFVYAGSKDKPNEDQPNPALEGQAFIHEVRWDTDMHSPVARKLVNESHSIFLNLQRDAHTKGSSDETKESIMLKHSREYRSVVTACILDIQHTLKHNPSDDKDVSSLEAQLQLFEIIELIWSLCEILYVEVIPGGMLISRLLQWMRLHFVEADHMATDVLREDQPHLSQSFWPAVTGYVLQGRLPEAMKLMSVHPEKGSERFRLIEQLMKRMPVYTSSSGLSIGEFDSKWHHWHMECMQRLQDGSFVAHPHLESICQILVGEDEAFIEHKDLSGTWYCMMISRLFYQNPTVKAFDLQENTQFCIDVYGGHSNLQPCDNILLAALEFDIHHVIHECSSSLSNWWFVSHFTDLLQHCGKLESKTLHFGSNLREFLLLEYAQSLMSHHSLWQVCILYLDHCAEYGKYYIEEFVERIPLETELKAQKVLKICEERDLQPQIRNICKVMGMRCLHNKHLGSALSWSLRSKDVAFATLVAEKFLDEYSSSGGFVDLDLLDNLGSSMLISSKLTFLGKYREFHRLYEDGDLKAAGSLLLGLLTARIAPRKFWLTLLLDALPLLGASSLIFSSEDTYELMHCMEEINIARKIEKMDAANSEDPTSQEEDIDEEKLELMRLALARNLAKAFVQEGTMKDLF